MDSTITIVIAAVAGVVAAAVLAVVSYYVAMVLKHKSVKRGLEREIVEMHSRPRQRRECTCQKRNVHGSYIS